MKKVPTVHELRKKGYKVRVTHVRQFFRFNPQTGEKKKFFAAFQSSKFYKKFNLKPASEQDSKEEFFLDCKGGETIIEIAYPKGNELGKGVSICSEQDSYVKQIGIRKATALALKNMEKNKKLNADSFTSLMEQNKDLYVDLRAKLA
jgi:hypothetical protein